MAAAVETSTGPTHESMGLLIRRSSPTAKGTRKALCLGFSCKGPGASFSQTRPLLQFSFQRAVFVSVKRLVNLMCITSEH